MTRKEKANLRRTRPRRVAGPERAEKGQSLVEAAIIVPILILLLAIVIDATRAFDAYIVLTGAAREGARFGSLDFTEPPIDVETLVTTDITESGTNVSNMQHFGEDSDDIDIDYSANTITVTLSYDFPLWFGGVLGLHEIRLSKSASMPLAVQRTTETE